MMSYIAFSVSTERKASVSQTNPPAVAAPRPPPLTQHPWNAPPFAVSTSRTAVRNGSGNRRCTSRLGYHNL